MEYDSDVAPSEPPRPSRRLWSWITPGRRLPVSVAAALGGGLAFGYLLTVLFVFPPQEAAGDFVLVPEVVGASAEEAQRSVEGRGLEYVEEAAFHHPKAVGSVLAQEPLPGQIAPPGAPVQVTLSLGPKERPVPDVVGLSHRQAEIALAQAGYEAEIDWVDAEADVGQVVGTRPEPGTPVPLPGRVRLLVSAGPRLVETPDLMSRSLAEARAALQRVGLRLGAVTQDSTSLAAPGTVLGQSPVEGSVVDRATPISVVVAIVPPEPPDTARDPIPNDESRQ